MTENDFILNWRRELENSRNYEKNSREESEKFYSIYNDQKILGAFESSKRYNIFWSNTQTLKPLIFSKLPKINITQRFFDGDNISRLACEIIERSLSYYLNIYDAEKCFERARDDYLIGGMGIARIVYDPEEVITAKETKKVKKKIKQEDGSEVETEIDEESQIEDLDSSSKKCRIEYVDWRDFAKSTEKHWSKLRWVGFRHFMSESEIEEEFGKKIIEELSFNEARLGFLDKTESKKEEIEKVCEVWEIWDKSKKKVYWLALNGNGILLDEQEDPYNLQGFFPIVCPLGLQSNPVELLPAPLYRFYKSQAEELNMIEDRIRNLVEQVRFTGVYSKISEQSDMENLFNGNDGQFSPLTTTAQTDDIRKSVMFKPIAEITAAINQLQERKAEIINAIRDISGISDIVRGVSVASETATAQQMKGNFAISRIQPLQKEFEFWVRDTLALLAELTVEKFSFQELAQITNLKIVDLESIAQAAKMKLEQNMQEAANMINPQDPDFQQKMLALQQQASVGFKKTMEKPLNDLKGFAVDMKEISKLESMLKDDKLRSINVDIETDSTIKIDQNIEKQERLAFMQAISATIQQLAPVVQSGVLSKDALSEFVIFASKPFKVGRNLENYLKKEDDEDEQPQQPSPQEMLAQAEIQLRQQELQLRQQEVMGKLQIEQQKVDVEKAHLLNRQNEFEHKLEFDDANKEADRQAKRLDIKTKAQTEIVNEAIRNANQPTQI